MQSSLFPAAFFFFVVGVCMGSFGNVLIARLPAGIGIGGRSRCISCGKTIRALQLIPIISFLFLRGRCKECAAGISLQYPLVELAGGVIFLIAFMHQPDDMLRAGLLGIALWLLFIIAVIDARTARIPDALNLPFIVAALGFAISGWQFPVSAVLTGTGFLGAQWLLSRGRWIGSGDVLLITGISLLLPDWQHVLVAFAVAYIGGAAFACVLLMRRSKSTADTLAFGPFLAVGGAVAVFLGEWVLRALWL